MNQSIADLLMVEETEELETYLWDSSINRRMVDSFRFNTTLSESDRRFVNELRSGLKPAPIDFEVFSGIKFEPFGDRIYFPAFISTSPNKDATWHFIKFHGDMYSGEPECTLTGYILRLLVPKGTICGHLPFSPWTEQQEVLIDCGHHVTILGYSDPECVGRYNRGPLEPILNNHIVTIDAKLEL